LLAGPRQWPNAGRRAALDTWDLITALRTEFLAQAKGLSRAQWDAPTLCEHWRVRDAVAHIILPERFPQFGGIARLIPAGWFHLDKAICQDAIRRGSVPIPDLLASYQAAIQHRSIPPGRQPVNVLADLVSKG